ncbi:response regulator [Massilia pseudoviolaceinigra]|uniref:response regulator n=1 Tax=Massilia pseudoviolaceinigra TaxID=3057165 RepID=UPI002796CAD3|nr:response regulator [Massilia sp. CCM 9206]MDQ1921040.1 response regulator [Massilia sp. CCM 9206]
MRRILLVDDEINVLNALVRAMRQHLEIEDLHIETFTDPFDALTRCAECTFDLVISDFRMPQMTGVEFLHAIKEVAPDTVRMILSASTEFETVTSAINDAQVFRFIPKPWQVGDLRENIRLAFEYRDSLRKQHQLADRQRVQEGTLSKEELALRKMEEEEPGLLKVKWGPNGEIIM